VQRWTGYLEFREGLEMLPEDKMVLGGSSVPFKGLVGILPKGYAQGIEVGDLNLVSNDAAECPLPCLENLCLTCLLVT
jgi:hypothetical protein